MDENKNQEYVELIPGIKMSKEEPFEIKFDSEYVAGSEFLSEFGDSSSPPPILDGKPAPMHLRYLMERLSAMMHQNYEKDAQIEKFTTLLHKAEKDSHVRANAAKEEFYHVLSNMTMDELEFLAGKCMKRRGHEGLIQFVYSEKGWMIYGVSLHEMFKSPARNESNLFSSLKETLIEYILNCHDLADKPGRTERMLKAVAR